MKSLPILTRMAVLVALGVVVSTTSIPMLGAKLFPAQAAVNVVAGVLLGPWYAAIVALMIAGFRILLGTGSLLAIPGSLFGALLAGFLYRTFHSRLAAMAGEVVGTGLLAALVAYPMAVFLMGSSKAAAAGITFYIIPFASSSMAGALLGGALLVVLERAFPAMLTRDSVD